MLSSEPGIEVGLCALYLRGLARSHDPPRRRWQAVEATLRQESASVGCLGAALRRRSGLEEEALALETPGLLAAAEKLIMRGEALTAASPGYPDRWLSVLRASAIPALWIRGEMPKSPYIAIVGSRVLGAKGRGFARETALEALASGHTVVSGGAKGCDQVAVSTALSARGPHAEVLPCGIEDRSFGYGSCRLSACAPDARFSTGGAIERNALVYAMAQATVVVRAQFKKGGSWHGAVGALRNKLCRVLVWDDPSSRASRALVALGGIPLSSPSDLADALVAIGPQGEMDLRDETSRRIL